LLVPSLSNTIAFTLLALVIIVVPGPSVLYAIGRALVLGTKPAIVSVLGNALGVAMQIIVVALGLGVVVQQSPTAFFVIKLAGAAMISYLGVRAILERGQLLSTEADSGSARNGVIVRQSVVVGITNAKTLVFFIAALPSFVSPAQGSLVTQMLALGALFLIIGISGDLIYAIAAGRARDWLASSAQRLALFRGLGGLALALLGLYMFIDALK
jgi:threonine/homoserine/homoserine lactone efflux protein